MTKARDISSLIGSSGQIDNTKITLDTNEIPNLDAGKITSGSLGTDRIPNLSADKITTGTFADARISNSSVSQHATSFDDNKLVNDISTLALRQASDQNKSSYNTNSQSVDVFQDDTGIDTITNASRNASEYVNSITGSSTTYAASTNLFNSSPFTDSASYASSIGTAASAFDGDGVSNSGSGFISGIVGFPQYAQIDFGSGNAYVINKYGIRAYQIIMDHTLVLILFKVQMMVLLGQH